MRKLINRRTALTGIGGTGLTLGASGLLHRALANVWESDRPILSRDRSGMTCDNAGVLVSSLPDRKATLVDFETSGTCALTKDAVEGPYFVCVGSNTGKNITGGLPGQPLTMALRVLDQTCTAVPGAIVDIWGCNAGGVYSAFDGDPDVEYRGGLVEMDMPSRDLRGTLATDADGIAEFDTIYPGFYAGRAIHIHFKVHIGNRAYLTSQALFPEAINSRILTMAPYDARRNTKRLLNAEDPDFIGDLGVFGIGEKGRVLLGTMDLIAPA